MSGTGDVLRGVAGAESGRSCSARKSVTKHFGIGDGGEPLRDIPGVVVASRPVFLPYAVALEDGEVGLRPDLGIAVIWIAVRVLLTAEMGEAGMVGFPHFTPKCEAALVEIRPIDHFHIFFLSFSSLFVKYTNI